MAIAVVTLVLQRVTFKDWEFVSLLSILLPITANYCSWSNFSAMLIWVIPVIFKDTTRLLLKVLLRSSKAGLHFSPGCWRTFLSFTVVYPISVCSIHLLIKSHSHSDREMQLVGTDTMSINSAVRSSIYLSSSLYIHSIICSIDYREWCMNLIGRANGLIIELLQ